MQLGVPARYFPVTRGLYEVTAGLKPLHTDFGNGAMDRRVFQIDSDFPRFRESKLSCRRDWIEKYVQQSDLSPDAERLLVSWLVHRLTTEYPDVFTVNGRRILCRHTQEEISLGEKNELLPDSNLGADYRSAFDALANQVAEDICLIQSDGKRDWLAAAHACSPGHWSAEDKIGKPFTAVHDPVPGIVAINQKAPQFVQAMIYSGQFVRFAWGIGTDNRLNHHPDPPAGIDPADWRGRRFDPANPAFYLRIERQVISGLPAINAAVFTIRVSHLNGEQIRANPEQRDQLISALNSMSPESRQYKGVEGSVEAITAWLRGG